MTKSEDGNMPLKIYNYAPFYQHAKLPTKKLVKKAIVRRTGNPLCADPFTTSNHTWKSFPAFHLEDMKHGRISTKKQMEEALEGHWAFSNQVGSHFILQKDAIFITLYSWIDWLLERLLNHFESISDRLGILAWFQLKQGVTRRYYC